MDKIFIEQAKSIRREYFKNSREVVKCEDEIDEYKKKLLSLQVNLEKNTEEEVLREKLILIEKNIKRIEVILEPYIKKMKDLQIDADLLFENIKKRHPELTTEQIQNELIPHLMKIKY